MASPFVGEIQAFAFGYAPDGWLPCDGRTLPVAQYQVLFSLIGTTFGGTATQFQLPNLTGRAVCGSGAAAGSTLTPQKLGATFGAAAITLTFEQLASHTHAATASAAGSAVTTAAPSAQSAISGSINFPTFTDRTVDADTILAPQAVSPAGGSSPHPNLQPYLPMLLCIATNGLYPQFP